MRRRSQYQIRVDFRWARILNLETTALVFIGCQSREEKGPPIKSNRQKDKKPAGMLIPAKHILREREENGKMERWWWNWRSKQCSPHLMGGSTHLLPHRGNYHILLCRWHIQRQSPRNPHQHLRWCCVCHRVRCSLWWLKSKLNTQSLHHKFLEHPKAIQSCRAEQMHSQTLMFLYFNTNQIHNRGITFLCVS